MLWLALIVALVVIVVIVVLVVDYNALIRVRNRVESAWAQIDVQLKRRHDLIPTLVDTVERHGDHDRATLGALVAARGQALAAAGEHDRAEAETTVTDTIRSLFAGLEADPELRASRAFLDLQEELVGSEDRIAYARQFFNDAVLKYNTKIDTFPALIFARRLGFVPREYFETDEEARSSVRVRF